MCGLQTRILRKPKHAEAGGRITMLATNFILSHDEKMELHLYSNEGTWQYRLYLPLNDLFGMQSTFLQEGDSQIARFCRPQETISYTSLHVSD